MKRLFIALKLSSAIKTEIVNLQNFLKQDFEDLLRFTATDQLHLTIKFLGDVAEDRLEEITEALDSIALNIRAFELSLAALFQKNTVYTGRK